MREREEREREERERELRELRELRERKGGLTTSTTSTTPTSTSTTPTSTSTTPTSTSGQKARMVIYVNKLTAWWPPTAIAAGLGIPGYTHDHAYNVVNISFWTSNTGPVDCALVWSNALHYVGPDNPWGSTTQEIQLAWAKAYHDAGIKVLVSAFGSTDFPTSQGADATHTGKALAQFVLDNNLDGADLDWEDNDAMNNGVGEQWIIDCTSALRALLPQSDGYLVSHAPQAPYFTDDPSIYPGGGYCHVDDSVGHLIDFYNIQFYNQGDCEYSTYADLFEKCQGWAQHTAVLEMTESGIKMDKIVVGKPVSAADATNTGYVPLNDLKQILQFGHDSAGWNGGFMGWQFSSDGDGSWGKSLAGSFNDTSSPAPSRLSTTTTCPTPSCPSTTPPAHLAPRAPTTTAADKSSTSPVVPLPDNATASTSLAPSPTPAALLGTSTPTPSPSPTPVPSPTPTPAAEKAVEAREAPCSSLSSTTPTVGCVRLMVVLGEGEGEGEGMSGGVVTLSVRAPYSMAGLLRSLFDCVPGAEGLVEQGSLWWVDDEWDVCCISSDLEVLAMVDLVLTQSHSCVPVLYLQPKLAHAASQQGKAQALV